MFTNLIISFDMKTLHLIFVILFSITSSLSFAQELGRTKTPPGRSGFKRSVSEEQEALKFINKMRQEVNSEPFLATDPEMQAQLWKWYKQDIEDKQPGVSYCYWMMLSNYPSGIAGVQDIVVALGAAPFIDKRYTKIAILYMYDSWAEAQYTVVYVK